MFELFKKDIQLGDKIKLFLTTGKEPEGIIIEIGENFILIKTTETKKTRYFDKLIGGWEILEKAEIKKSESKKNTINKELLITSISNLKYSIEEKTLSKFIEPNAKIYEVRGTTCLASNDEYSKILILNNKIIDENLISELEDFKIGSFIPVWLQYYVKKKSNDVMATVVIKPNMIGEIIEKIELLIKNEKYEETKLLLWVLKPYVKRNKYLGELVRELKKIKVPISNPKKIIINNTEDPVERKQFKTLEKQINDLIRKSNFDEALKQIEIDIKKDIPIKYKSSLLLKKAQIFSSLNQPDNSEQAYQELINFNESTNASKNNLSHLYTELARLQSLNSQKINQAIKNVKKALKYNPNNNFANNLLKQIELKHQSDIETNISDEEGGEEHLVIESTEDTTTISKLIDIDIREHKFTHPEILKNGGKPTAFLAKMLLEQAKENRDIDISERYPAYLEAAKAFSLLNVGSYDWQDYLEAVAYYSMLKGNSLYINYRNLVLSGELNILKLTRLKDSASSYFIEALNLLSNIAPKSLLLILANYLKLNIVNYHIKNSIDADFNQLFKGQFGDVFSFCLKNENKEIEKIAYQTIIEIGSASVNAWNKLAELPKGEGIGILYSQFYSQHKFGLRKKTYKIINDIIKSNIDLEIKPRAFLKESFHTHIQSKNNLKESFNIVQNYTFEPSNFDLINKNWEKLQKFNYLFNDTDIETKIEIENVLSIIKPYLNRNETERTNILLQARAIVEKQIQFINNNTTYYGRTLFYGLLTNWKKEIDELLEVKISETLPQLEIQIDPPYYIKASDNYTAQLIINNKGETTAEGFDLEVFFDTADPEYEYEDEIKEEFNFDIEISSGNKIKTELPIPDFLIEDFEAVEIKLIIKALYQGKYLQEKEFLFTIEKEPESELIYEDIPWKDGPIPPEHLFKGRSGLINDLLEHYLSTNRDKPYILYGLTRTGKSSILKYLKKAIEGETISIDGAQHRIIAFDWEFQELSNNSNAKEFYQDLLYERVFKELKTKFIKLGVWDNEINIPEEKTKFKHLKELIEYILDKKFYPMFFIDELSYIKDLMDRKTIGPSFLAALRQYSLDGKASFIFAGTYDIKRLITDEAYGITGQFVHAIEYQVDKIKDHAAEELINVIKDKLTFTFEAVKHIKFLSGNIPYFIQIICKSCGDYAVENNRRFIGYPELEKVVRILTGEEDADSSLVKRLPPGKFQNNQYSPSDPKEIPVLISSIAFFNKNSIVPRGIGIHELERLWAEHKLNSFRAKLASSLEDLLEKKILYQEEDEGLPVYKFSVDLFRRWWYNQHQDISLELTTLID